MAKLQKCKKLNENMLLKEEYHEVEYYAKYGEHGSIGNWPEMNTAMKKAIDLYKREMKDNELGEDSFKHILNWAKDIKAFCGDIPVVIFGNKSDLIDKDNIDETAIQELIKKSDFLDYYITSAKTGEGVIPAFDAIIDELYNKFKDLSTDLIQ